VNDVRQPIDAAAASAPRVPRRTQRRGAGHRVLVLPGLAAGDASTLPLRWALQAHGHSAHGWGLGRNVGPTRRVVAGLRDRLVELAEGERVSLVGWSLGGVFARQLSRERPELVRQVITMGSPYRMVEGRHTAGAVPATSIYTRDDRVVRWHMCIDEVGPEATNRRAENIEVYGTHVGLGVNPAVIVAILDRLAQPEDGWRPFRAPLALKPWYPRPSSWSPRPRAA
jgi:pimeloyl-ACP methyl ester carboxylesterase